MLNATPNRIKEIAGAFALCAQQEHAGLAVRERMTVSASVAGGRSMPLLIKDDAVARQRRDTLRVLKWEPVRGARAGLDPFILIDDASRQGKDSSVGREMNSYAIFPRIKLREQKCVSWRWDM